METFNCCNGELLFTQDSLIELATYYHDSIGGTIELIPTGETLFFIEHGCCNVIDTDMADADFS